MDAIRVRLKLRSAIFRLQGTSLLCSDDSHPLCPLDELWRSACCSNANNPRRSNGQEIQYEKWFLELARMVISADRRTRIRFSALRNRYFQSAARLQIQAGAQTSFLSKLTKVCGGQAWDALAPRMESRPRNWSVFWTVVPLAARRKSKSHFRRWQERCRSGTRFRDRNRYSSRRAACR